MLARMECESDSIGVDRNSVGMFEFLLAALHVATSVIIHGFAGR